LGWCWFKYYRNPRNFLTIPKNSNYANMEVLIQVFNGNVIDTSKKWVERVEED
jgi:hypothetical protein